MKWCAMAAFALAIIVRLTWHSSVELGFPVSATADVGYPVSTVLFWMLLILGLLFSLFAFIKRAR